ncbi:MAG: aminoglycoside 6'-N-acetyltransferase [Candidatus Gracilibacteria bacterium]|jgi:aminoglycoside 6'-N-acetyltransferase I
MNFCEISEDSFNEWVSMGVALWPHHTKKEIEKEFRSQLSSDKYQTFLAQKQDGQLAGFINLSLRSDYVEGASTSLVGYIEGIYIKPEYRKQGVAKELIKVAEKWAKKCKCKELGSDTELSNIESQKFHKNLGFKKADTIVHFIKKIK